MPPPINPTMLLQDQPLGQLPQAPMQGTPMMPGVLPQPSPVQAQGQPNPLQDYGALAQQQIGQLTSSAPAQEAAGARASQVGLAQQAAGMQLPKYGPQVEPGASFLHNLGQALLMAGGMTAPGQALNREIYGPGERAYAGRQAGLAEQIKATQAQAEGAEKEVGTLGTVAGRNITGGAAVIGKGEMAGAFEQRTQMLAQQAANRFTEGMARIGAMKDIAEKRNATQTLITQMRDETMRSIASDRNLTQEQVQGMKDATMSSLLNTKDAQDPSIKAAIMNMFGVETPQVPAGATPQMRAPTPAAPTAAGNPVPKGTIVYDPKGTAHTSDGTQPLPKGWSLKKGK